MTRPHHATRKRDRYGLGMKTRRSFCTLAASCLLVVTHTACRESPDSPAKSSSSATPSATADSGSQPSVLLLTVDTLRPDYLSMNGYDRPTSPYIDGLLADSFYFERATTPVTRTTPALASMLTGAYPHATKVRTLTDPLSDDVVTITETFKKAGYQTVAVVTNRVLTLARRLDRGFDVYDHKNDICVARFTSDRAVAHLERLDPGKPMFAWIHYIDPHVPYHSDPPIIAEFDPDYSGRYQLNFGIQPRPDGVRQKVKPFPPNLPKRVCVHNNPLPETVNRHIRRLYAAEVRSTDNELKRVVDAAKDKYGENLIIIFTADHGESLGEHNFYFDHGDYVYNACARVPLGIVLSRSHPAYNPGRCRDWVSLVDIVPTLFELVGRPVPPELQKQIEGRSLVPYMTGETTQPQPVFAECGHSFFPEQVRRRKMNTVAGRFRAVFLGDWKLIWTPFQTEDLAWELYKIDDDPHETVNLYTPDDPQAAALRNYLKKWYDLSADTGYEQRDISDTDLKILRELGYVQ